MAVFCATLSLSWAKPQNCNSGGCSAGRGNYNQAVGGSEYWPGSSGPMYQPRFVTFIFKSLRNPLKVLVTCVSNVWE